MNADYYWANKDSDGQMMAKDYGLISPQLIMCTTAESGDCLYMFQCGDNEHYLWNQIELEIWKIDEPKSLGEIFAKMHEWNVGSLKMTSVPSVSIADD